MGAQYIHQCDSCGHSVTTSGPWEFYRNAEGKRKLYGHPVPASDEAVRHGIHGLSAHLYCADCGHVSNLVIVEYKHPTTSALNVWSGACEPKDEYARLGAVCCTRCRGKRLMLEPDETDPPPCRACGCGRLKGEMEWIS